MRLMVADRGMGEPISLGAALAAGKKVGPDVTQFLAADHRTVLGWFDWYEHTQDQALRRQLAARICLALRAHMAGEEDYLYPAAERHTGDRDLVERSVREHDGAKQLMSQIESARSADGEHPELMRRLRQEIETHVDEEENELFPAVRASTMDLYAVGRAGAARRAEYLFRRVDRSNGRLKEIPDMDISQDEARHFFIVNLKNIHAAARDGRNMVETQIERLEQYPKLKQKLESHLGEKNAQLERVERILDKYDEGPSKMKDAAMSIAAALGSAATMPAKDEILKNSLNMLALATYEAASYETLLLFGEAAGDVEALPDLQKCVSEERGLASFIEEHLRSTGMRFLQLRSEGAQASH
jgi:ferritin-like metal-binding protein YciE/hemerythrin superfamily protein